MYRHPRHAFSGASCLAILLSLALASPTTTWAAAPEAAAAAQVPESWQRGQSHYDAGQFQQAIDVWTLETMLGGGLTADQQVALTLLVVGAHERAFDVSRDPKHITQGKALLDAVERDAAKAYAADPAKLEQAQAEIDAARRRLEAREGGADPAPVVAPVPAPTPAPEPAPQPDPEPQPQPQPQPVTDPEPAPRVDTGPPPSKSGGGLVGGGAALVVAGAGGFGLMAGGMVMASRNNDFSDIDDFGVNARAAQVENGTRGNKIAIAGAVVGSVLLAAGVTMIVLGKMKQKGKIGGKRKAMLDPVRMEVRF